MKTTLLFLLIIVASIVFYHDESESKPKRIANSPIPGIDPFTITCKGGVYYYNDIQGGPYLLAVKPNGKPYTC